MNKPQMRQEARVTLFWDGHAEFYATPDAVKDFEQFGYIEKFIFQNKYWMSIDARFDTEEVVIYINNYGKEK